MNSKFLYEKAVMLKEKMPILLEKEDWGQLWDILHIPKVAWSGAVAEEYEAVRKMAVCSKRKDLVELLPNVIFYCIRYGETAEIQKVFPQLRLKKTQ